LAKVEAKLPKLRQRAVQAGTLLSTGEVELHGLRIAYDNVAELAEAAMALLEEYRESEHGEIRRQTRERLKRAIDEAGR
jgi:hypothetical protein